VQTQRRTLPVIRAITSHSNSATGIIHASRRAEPRLPGGFPRYGKRTRSTDDRDSGSGIPDDADVRDIFQTDESDKTVRAYLLSAYASDE